MRIKKKQKITTRIGRWLSRNLFVRARRKFVYVILLCACYLILYHNRIFLREYFHLNFTGLFWNKFILPILRYFNVFFTHYFPDIIAAFTIYLLIDEGIKMLVGTREEKKRDYKFLINSFEFKAKDEIIIFDTFINGFIWTISPNEMCRVFKSCVEKGVYIKILILYPNSQAAKQRIKDLKNSKKIAPRTNELEKEINDNNIVLFKLWKEISELSQNKTLLNGEVNDFHNKSENFSVLLYDRSPIMSYYGWDETAYFSLMTPDAETDNAPNLLISNYSLFGNYVRGLVDQITESTADNPSITILDYMVMSFEPSLLETVGIQSDENQVYFGIQDQENYPTYLAARLDQNDITVYLESISNKQTIMKFRGKFYTLEIVSILRKNIITDEYANAIRCINKTYNLKSRSSRKPSESIDFFRGRNPTIFQISFLNKKNITTGETTSL